MAMAKALHITPELLQAAWAQRRRADWPATYTDAMQHPLLGRLVRCEAVRLALAQARAQRWGSGNPQRAAAAPQRRPALPQPPIPIDRKRLAAGETLDD